MPTSNFKLQDRYTYLNGFGSYHEAEAIRGALPVGQNSPQRPPYGLFAEKFSGTAFTTPRHENQQSWCIAFYQLQFMDRGSRLRWNPFDFSDTNDWVSGMHLVAEAGDPAMKSGLAIFVFAVGKNMREHEAFYSADGDMLIVPQHGALDIITEFGRMLVRANEICVIPRGVRYRVLLPDGQTRGYILELYQGHFQLPELGPIGSNKLANARDFQVPMAYYENDTDSEWTVLSKFNRKLFYMVQRYSPCDVVAWHGTYYPYKYDLGRFNTSGSISFDHPDPSIFTVLTAPSNQTGTAITDFVIFPPR